LDGVQKIYWWVRTKRVPSSGDKRVAIGGNDKNARRYDDVLSGDGEEETCGMCVSAPTAQAAFSSRR